MRGPTCLCKELLSQTHALIVQALRVWCGTALTKANHIVLNALTLNYITLNLQSSQKTKSDGNHSGNSNNCRRIRSMKKCVLNKVDFGYTPQLA